MTPSFPRAELVTLLSATLGEEKANETIVEACRILGLRDETFNRDEALGVLEKIAQTPGLVGITARFAKTRVYLKW
jgi:hypothetical protein